MKVHGIMQILAATILFAGFFQCPGRLCAEENAVKNRHEKAVAYLKGIYAVGLLGDKGSEGEVVEIRAGRTFTDKDACYLADLPELRYFDAAGDVEITNSVMSFLENATNLTDFSIDPSRESEMTEEFLKYAEKLPRLRSIWLGGPNVTDRGLFSLGKIKSLQKLSFYTDKITEFGIRQLERLPNLHDLKIWHWSDADDGIFDLSSTAKLSELESLSVSGSGIRGEDIAKLKSLHHLRRLELSSTKIRGGLEGLQELPYLEELNLSETNITDDDMAAVAKVKTLKKLRLYKTEITDKGLASLANLAKSYNLKELDITYTKVTAVGLKELRWNVFNLERIIVTPGGKNGIPNKPMADLQDSAGRAKIEGYDGYHPYHF